MKGRIALVTGAGRGIGRAIGMAIGSCGAHVVLAARSGDQFEEAAGAVRDAGGKATAIVTP